MWFPTMLRVILRSYLNVLKNDEVKLTFRTSRRGTLLTVAIYWDLTFQIALNDTVDVGFEKRSYYNGREGLEMQQFFSALVKASKTSSG